MGIALTCSVHSTSAQMEKGDGLSARTVALAKPQRSSTIASRGRDGHKRRKSGAARRSNWVVLPNPRNSTIASRGSHGHKKGKSGAAKKQLGCPPAVDCSDMQCAFDICPDGKGRRPVGKDCCSCEAAAEQYNCFTRESWSQKKKKWCCAKKQLGCPPKPAKQYNCFTRERWSQKKKKWCCAKKQLGCPPKPAKQYNCFTRESWSQ